MNTPRIAVLCGGTSAERDVSIGSGRASAAGLRKSFETDVFELENDALPAGLDPAVHVVFSTLHGTFGEDGGMQRLLDDAGVAYAGCDAAASALCFAKERTKRVVEAAGVPVVPGVFFDAAHAPGAAELVGRLGENLVFKPNCQGSSVGMQMASGWSEVACVLSSLGSGEWVVERRVFGTELTVGLLGGRAMGVVEIVPQSGRFDFTSKYTKGLTQYFAPARIPDAVAAVVKRHAEAAFAACGCRDYARIDFMLGKEDGGPVLLEINTLPGMKETSLLPMSARCTGLDFDALVRELVTPAIGRWGKCMSNRTGAGMQPVSAP